MSGTSAGSTPGTGWPQSPPTAEPPSLDYAAMCSGRGRLLGSGQPGPWVSATGLGPRAQLIFVYGRLQSFTPFSQLRPPRSSGFAPLMTCLAMPPISTCVRASPPRRSPHSNVAVPGSALQSSR